MLNIGVFTPYHDDHERNIQFCRDAEVGFIIPSTDLIAGDGNIPSASQLKQLVAQYADGNVCVEALTPPRLSNIAFVDATIRQQELDQFQRLLEAMGEARIPLLHFYLNVTEPIPEASAARQQMWDGMVEVYRELVRFAEATNVRISTHHYHRADRMLWNYETMSTLLNDLGSPYAGVTYCQGKSVMAGDNLPEDILNYGDEIFIFHFRDVVTKPLEQMSDAMEQRFADTGYIEVPFGTGEVDMIGSMRSLKKIGYKGTVYPEHYPSIAGDSAAGLAWTLGYMRALYDAVQM